jgi:O-antigen/teichoic acid export membrane protein
VNTQAGLRNKLVSQTSLIMAARIVGAAIMFAVQVALARIYGQETLAAYVVAIATTNILAAVMPLGFQVIAAYFAADYGANQNGGSLRRFATQAYAQAILAALVAVLVGPFLLASFGEQRLLAMHIWPSLCLMALATALVFLSGAILVALKRPLVGFAADTLVKPFVMATALLITVLSVTTAGDAVSSLLVWAAVLYMMCACIHAVLATQSVLQVPVTEPAPPGERLKWWRFAWPWIILAIATDFFFDLDILLLTYLLGEKEIAVFGVTVRIFALLAFANTAIYSVVLPDIFASRAADMLDRIRTANRVACLASLALAGGALVFAPFIFQIFGTGFEAGTVPLALLCLSLAVRAYFGPTALALSLKDKPWSALPSVALGFATLIMANYLLVPTWGLLGAAVAALAAVLIWSFAMWATALKLTGLDVSLNPRARP